MLVGLLLFLTACGGGTTSSGIQDKDPSFSATSDVLTQVTPTNKTFPTSVTPMSQENTLTIEEVTQGSIKASQDIDSYTFDMNFSMSLSLSTSEGVSAMYIEETGIGLIDIADRQMELDMSIVMDIPNEGKHTANAKIYSMDGWLYVKTTVPDSGEQWTKMELTDELWKVQSQFSSMIDFLKIPSGIYLSGSETIQGIDCFVVEVTPDPESLLDWAAGQTLLGQNDTSLKDVVRDETFRKFTVKEWIAKDTLLPIKAIVEIAMDISSDEIGSDTGNVLDISVSITFSEYGNTVNIQLPPEAFTAKELISTN